MARIGSPTYSAFGSGVPGKLTATRSATRAPALLASPGSGVLLVDDQRQLPPAGGEVGRHRDVAAVADHHVGPHPVEDVEGLADRAAQPGRHLEQVGVGAPRAAARAGSARAGSPASGTTRVSSPRAVPRQVISTSGSSRRSASAVAIRGEVWPAVPPPARRMRIGVEPRDARQAPAGARGPPRARRSARGAAGRARARPRARGARSRSAGRARPATGSSAEPPYETSGSGMPITGSSASTMPTLMIIWPSSQTTMPKDM